jgi:hypothetical protein
VFYLINGSSSFTIEINDSSSSGPTLNLTGTSTSTPASTSFTATFTKGSSNSVGFFNASKAAPAVDHIVVTAGTGGGGGQTATPVLSPGSESFTSSASVTISDSTSGATIYYTTNGSTPTTSSTKYSGAITVTATETIEAIAVASGDTNSAVASATYTLSSEAQTATPVISPGSESFTSSVSVTISDSTSGASIYYTTDGSTPTTSSTKYSSAIKVSATETIEAIAVASGDTNSAVASATYTLGSSSSGKVFAPFEYVGDLSDANQVAGIVSSSKAKAVILAFLVPNGSGCNLEWPGANGELPSDTIGSTSMATAISSLQASGVTVGISQGGYGGQEAAAYCSSASATQAVYQQIITKYNVKWLDFDIEYTETSGQSTRRATALAALQKANPGLIISFTLPADTPGDGVPDGLDESSNGGTEDVTDAISAGVSLTYINGMTMDFGNETTDQATLTDETAAAIESWIKSEGFSSKVGVTVLPGTSDDSGAVKFTLADATTVANFANANSYIGLVSFWELNRDNGGCSGSSSDEDTCSGITQSAYEFSSLFEAY